MRLEPAVVDDFRARRLRRRRRAARPRPSSITTSRSSRDAVAHRKRDAPPLESAPRTRSRSTSASTCGRTIPTIRPLTFHPALGQAAAELLGVERRPAVARPGAVQGGRRTRDRSAPGPPVLADDARPTLSPRGSRSSGSTLESGAMGYLPGSHAVGIRKFVNIFSDEDASRADGHARDPRHRAACSSRYRVARSRSTTASPSTWRSRTPPTPTDPCTRSSTSPTGARAATPAWHLVRRPRRHRGRRADRGAVHADRVAATGGRPSRSPATGPGVDPRDCRRRHTARKRSDAALRQTAAAFVAAR